MGRARHRACAAALSLAVLAAGCGDGGDARTGTSRASRIPEAGGNGILVYALPSAPVRLDPLLARSSGAETIAAQIYEPLGQTLTGPYGAGARRRPGLALGWSASAGRTVWRFRLRRGVRFQDGSAFNATAILANAERWSSDPAGRALLPDLVGADSPRPGLVRFVLGRPSHDFPGRLARPQLGIVSPGALASVRGGAERLDRDRGAGTGPFTLVRRGEADLSLTRNREWWGTAEGLGPALDGVQFPIVSDQRQRAGLLRGGQAQLASQLDASLAERLAADPLLLSVRQADGSWLGMERSVRGLSREPASFSSVWLTRLGQR
jgi:peptide/nickel transport system substrate-binding protein